MEKSIVHMDELRAIAQDYLRWLDTGPPPRVYFAGATPILQYRNAPAPNLEICYLEEGSIEDLHVGPRVVDIAEGAVSINNMHFGNWSPSKSARGLAWCAILDASHPPPHMAYIESRPVVAAVSARRQVEIRDVFRRLRRHCARHNPDTHDYQPSAIMYDPHKEGANESEAWAVKGLLIELVALVLASASGATDEGAALTGPIQRVRDLMEEQFADPDLSLAMLASAACLSMAQFGRRFAAETGETPMGYVQQLRLREAALLLRHTRQQIGDIAASVGFSDPLYFSKAFRQAYGTSPRAFRDNGLDGTGSVVDIAKERPTKW